MGKGQRLKQERANASVATVQRSGISEHWFYMLRYIAIVSMFIDHLGRVLFLTARIGAIPYAVCYVIGRLAFPLFAFELAESFYYTKSKGKHLLRLGLLALVSEFPFDTVSALSQPTEYNEDNVSYLFEQQNVCITLFLGFLLLLIADVLDKALFKLLHRHRFIGQTLSGAVKLILTTFFGILAAFLKSDYTWEGIVAIVLFAVARNATFGRWTNSDENTNANGKTMAWQGVVLLWFIIMYGFSGVMLIPLCASFVLICIAEIRSAYTPKTVSSPLASKSSKYFCRWFYPLHLALLGTLRGLLVGWKPFL